MLSRRSFLGACGAGASAAISRPARAAWRARAHPRAETLERNAALLETVAHEGGGKVPWKWIVVHHTAAEYATLQGIDRYHRNHFGDALGAEYHFIIGNGRKSPAGLIQPARWRYGVRAGHLFHPERAPDSLAVCLVGNFQHRAPSGAEMDGLEQVTRTLMQRFSIPVDRVTNHRGVDKRLTQCPGRRFPTDLFLRRLTSPE